MDMLCECITIYDTLIYTCCAHKPVPHIHYSFKLLADHLFISNRKISENTIQVYIDEPQTYP
jgi:hypothetical protein